MSHDDPFDAGNDGFDLRGDAARQAVDSLRGYAYQVIAAALAWLDLEQQGKLFLEVAEDYAVVVRDAIEAVQVKDTEASGTVTLNTDSVQGAVSHFVSLTSGNPGVDVQLRYLTTSGIGKERAVDDRPGGMAGLDYWRMAATGADVGPLRSILESNKFSTEVQNFVRERNDEALRSDMLQKIHWDCGKPDINSLRMELEERMIVVGRDKFDLPTLDATRVVDMLIYRVLEKSIAKGQVDRVLTRADLCRAIDQATRISVPRHAAEMMAISSGLAATTLTCLGNGLPVAIAELGWLFDGNALPPAKRMVPREAIETGIADRIRRFGASIVVGASGLGKSLVARAVARSQAAEFTMVDFRNANAEETRSRLNAMFARIGSLRAPIVIFDDLNHFNDPLVALSVTRVFEALRRRDRAAIVTCYRSPTANALSNVGLDAGCLIECPYFTEEEAKELVTLHGGDPNLWGRLAYVAGGSGHPQLVHAFIVGMGARGWPPSALSAIVSQGFSSGDIEAEREAAQRRLVSEIPESGRSLLYRLSLTVGSFDRTLALIIANAPPPITLAGEYLDALIGPWLETLGRNNYRVSPLVARLGRGMMPPTEQATIHSVIASQLVASGTIDGGDADRIMAHALVGKNEQVLLILARSILMSDERTTGFLADVLAVFRLLRTDTPLFPDSPPVSQALRLAQFKILVAARETEKIAGCVSALLTETDQQPTPELHRAFQAMTFATVLGTMGIANYLDNWLDLLQQFQVLMEANKFMNILRDDYEVRKQRPSNIFGMLFAIGSTGIFSVARLESVINRLDQLDTAKRSLYLSAILEIAPDFSILINGAWSSESKRATLNAVDAAERYRRMALKTASWGIRPVMAQCWIARAVMLDEYSEDSQGALRALDEALEAVGEDILLSRARAKIYWRLQDHERALQILRKIADEVGRDNHVERAFALREAAISAAKCGEWALAEAWFLESKSAAAACQLPDMTIMAIGLGADAAVAALQIEEIDRALINLSDSLKALSGIDPTSSLSAMYCHQIIRHTVLWAQAHIDRNKVDIDGAPIAIVPGCCSNPEPPDAVNSRSLGPIDLAWYMLANSEVTSGKNVGIADNLYDRLTSGPIPVMEIDLRVRRVKRDITDLNANGFARHLWSHVEAFAHLYQQGQQMMATFDVLKPARGDIPTVPRGNLSAPPISTIAGEALFAYAIAAACKHSAEALSDLEAALSDVFDGDVPGAALLARTNAAVQQASASSFDDALSDAVSWFRSDTGQTPKTYCLAAIRFFQQAGRSNFKSYLIPIIAAWQRDAWTRIVVSETFRLLRPLRDVPAVKAALSMPNDDERFLGTLILATANATGTVLPQKMQAEFIVLAAMPAAG